MHNGRRIKDLAPFLSGNVSDAFARTAALGYATEVEDTSCVSPAFAGGAIESVESAWTATGWEETFRVCGARGALRFTNRAERPKLLRERRSGGSASCSEPDATHCRQAPNNARAGSLRRFVVALETRKVGLPDQGAPAAARTAWGRRSWLWPLTAAPASGGWFDRRNWRSKLPSGEPQG